MSRAYRIKVRETLRRLVRASDHVSTQLELLPILPQEQMAALLAEELKRRGFTERDGKLVRSQDGVEVVVEPATGTVTVQADMQEDVELEAERTGRAYDDVGPSGSNVRKELKKEVLKDLEKQACDRAAALESEVADRLEGMLGDLRRELDQAVNRTTAEALKQKAGQIGQIKEMTEDPESGSLTIVLEV